MDDIQTTDPSRLARLFPADEPATAHWGRNDLQAVLKHQLAALLTVDLKLDSSDVTRGTKLDSFRDVLRHSSPPLTLLTSIKDFAKTSSHPGGAALPKEIATVLYYVAIVLARTRHGERITTLPDPSMAAGLKWALSQKWLDAEVRELFQNTELLHARSASRQG